MKLKPLTQFFCDECGGLIEKVEDGWLEWYDDYQNPIHGFRIVHASGASPRWRKGGNCYYPESGDISDDHLVHFTKDDGLARLLSFFKRNLSDPSELSEIINRIHIPHFEEARVYLARAIKDGVVDSFDNSQSDLLKVIEVYGND
jgi:hypothetical protein